MCGMGVMLMSCSDSSVEEVINPDVSEPFPKGQVIAVDASLSTASQTRAVGKTFETNDQLLAYVEAGKLVEEVFTPVVNEGGFSDTEHKNHYSQLLKFTLSADTETAKNNQPTDEDFKETYYWDDFSTLTYDLRDTDVNRGIRLKYGYCFNGGTPDSGSELGTDEKKAAGVIHWTVNSDQKTNGTKTSDLLMATTQKMIKYNHSDVDARGTLVMPFTHAMSQFTIEVRCGTTFAEPEKALANTEVNLHNAQVKCIVDAPTGTVTPVSKDVTGAVKEQMPMHPEDASASVKRFTAIVAPTNLTVGNILANITEVNGIPYQIDVTESLLNNAAVGKQAWISQLVEEVEDVQEGIAQSRPSTRADGNIIERGKGYRTKPGVNYKLVVSVDKQKIDVYATIADWVEVETEAKGIINFSNDIKTTGYTDLGSYNWFDVFRATNNSLNLHFDEDKSTTGRIDEATYYSKSGTTWSNTPDIYWPNGNDKYYFRALGSNITKNSLYGPLVTTSAVNGSDDITIKNGATNDNDMIWGTTEADTEHSYAVGDAIAPRSGDVPLTFKHLLTKVSFNLKTSAEEAKAVNLEGARIQISNIYNECHLVLATGVTSVTGTSGYLYSDNGNTLGRATTYNTADKVSKLLNQIVTPQSISNDVMLIITLADGTSYKVQLNTCVKNDANGDPTAEKITTWAQGEHYTYTIYLEKEIITLRAMIKAWDEKTGGGNATLEWD